MNQYNNGDIAGDGCWGLLYGPWGELENMSKDRHVFIGTDQKSQDALYQALKSIPGIIIYRQDFDEHNSMAAILKQGATKETARQIATLAKKHNVGIDLENDVTNNFIDEIYKGTADGLIDFYDTDKGENPKRREE